MTPESETEDAVTSTNWPPVWQPPPGLPEPAREVWLAGLGAFSRAQAEGGKAFQALVRQGLTLQTQASQVAQERIAKAAQPWERISGLSGIFEDRVARALVHLGQPAAQDWAALQARVQALEAALQDVLHGSISPNDPHDDLHDAARATAPRPARAKKSPARAQTPSSRATPGKKTRSPALP